MTEKNNFLVKFFQKVPKNAFLARFFRILTAANKTSLKQGLFKAVGELGIINLVNFYRGNTLPPPSSRNPYIHPWFTVSYVLLIFTVFSCKIPKL